VSLLSSSGKEKGGEERNLSVGPPFVGDDEGRVQLSKRCIYFCNCIFISTTDKIQKNDCTHYNAKSSETFEVQAHGFDYRNDYFLRTNNTGSVGTNLFRVF
jgi:hypothetical protein